MLSSSKHLHNVVELDAGFTVTIDRDPRSTAAQIIADPHDGDVEVELWFDAYKLVHWAQAMAALQHGALFEAEEIYAEDREGGVTVTPDSRLVFSGLARTVAATVDPDDLAELVNLATASSAGL